MRRTGGWTRAGSPDTMKGAQPASPCQGAGHAILATARPAARLAGRHRRRPGPPPVRPGRAGPQAGPGVSVGGPHQAATGRGTGALAGGGAGAGGPGAVAGGRWRRRQGAAPQAGQGAGGRGGQPAAPRRRLARPAAGGPPAGPAGAAADLRQGEDQPGRACRAEKRGWRGVACVQYGEKATKAVKSFEATWRPAGGRMRVVLVREAGGWLAYFCTGPRATAAEVLEAMAGRGALEQAFKGVKGVWGAGQQQVRNVYAGTGAFAVDLTMRSVVEAGA